MPPSQNAAQFLKLRHVRATVRSSSVTGRDRFPGFDWFARPDWTNAGLFFRFIGSVCFPPGFTVLPNIYTNEDFEISDTGKIRLTNTARACGAH